MYIIICWHAAAIVAMNIIFIRIQMLFNIVSLYEHVVHLRALFISYSAIVWYVACRQLDWLVCGTGHCELNSGDGLMKTFKNQSLNKIKNCFFHYFLFMQVHVLAIAFRMIFTLRIDQSCWWRKQSCDVRYIWHFPQHICHWFTVFFFSY